MPKAINTVGDLIKALSLCPQGAKIIMSSDEEGNSYHYVLTVVKNDNVVTLYPGGEF